MTEITTADELEALPVGAKVTDCDKDHGAFWVKVASGRWSYCDQGAATSGARVAQLWAPFKVTHLPVPAAVELHMTRCCGSDSCTATTPLPPGSTWLCSAHSNLLPGGGTR